MLSSEKLVINGKNILQNIDFLIGSTVRILTVQEEELYGAGYQGIVTNIKKTYFDKGHYDVYNIYIDTSDFVDKNRLHDSHNFEGKAYMDMEFFNPIIVYRICVPYNEFKILFEDDLEINFFEVLGGL